MTTMRRFFTHVRIFAAKHSGRDSYTRWCGLVSLSLFTGIVTCANWGVFPPLNVAMAMVAYFVLGCWMVIRETAVGKHAPPPDVSHAALAKHAVLLVTAFGLWSLAIFVVLSYL
jgi:hypothetical protein